MTPHLRIARPVTDLDRSVAMYTQGLGLTRLAGFRDHQGFDGVMLGEPGGSHHFEFTCCPGHPVRPTPTPEDLLVFYVPDLAEWRSRCQAMQAAGFLEVTPFNPYWLDRGCTFQDADGYRVVLQRAAWGQAGASVGSDPCA